MELLPKQYEKPRLHRVKVNTYVFKKLEEIRRKKHLWDREAAILWLLEECGYGEEESETKV